MTNRIFIVTFTRYVLKIKSYCAIQKSTFVFTVCKSNFDDIEEWVEERSGKESAICPHCGIDSVISYKVDGVYEINDKTLDELNGFYFSPF